jgi:hypothetical protein
METSTYENFPAQIVLLSNTVALVIYALGAYILGRAGIFFVLLYLLYCLWVESNVLRKSCVHCYYYGKICAFGKGKLCSWLLRKGDPQRFIEREVSWREIVPDMMVLIFPLIGGIVLLIKDFSWLLMVLLALVVVLSFGGNAIVRGSFACKHCKQRELGCPAQQLFDGKKA